MFEIGDHVRITHDTRGRVSARSREGTIEAIDDNAHLSGEPWRFRYLVRIASDYGIFCSTEMLEHR